ncbi:MAG: DUF1684 domain-containing protein [Chloroflexota bacterium]
MSQVTKTYEHELTAWHKAREEAIKSPDGWLRLAGLYWLEEGANSFGSDPSNSIVFPVGKAAPQMGTILVEHGRISTKILPDVIVTHQDEPITTLELRTDRDEGGPTILSHGLLSWFVISRDGRFAIRLKDLESPYLAQFSGIDTFPFDPTWRIPAVFEPYDPPKEVPVPNILGNVNIQLSPGALVFTVDGQTQRIDVLNTLEYPSIIFADATTTKETYGGGRFLIVDPINPAGENFVDFNKAINPPCAFSPYATCPLPPPQNRLPVPIYAGEKTYHYH